MSKKTPLIKVDEALLNRLKDEQLDRVHEMTSHDTWMDDYDGKEVRRWISDDGYDYLSAALDLAGSLLSCWAEGDVKAAEDWLNNQTPDNGGWMYGLMSPIMDHYACDGVCRFISELDCEAMKEHD